MTTIESSGQINHQGWIELDEAIDLLANEAIRVTIWPLATPAEDEPAPPRIEATGRINHQGQIELDELTELPPGEMIRVQIETLYALPYDDDHEWNSVFLKSLSVLQRLAEKAQQDHEQGKTLPLEPNNL